MNLQAVSLTGADDTVSPSKLLEISARFPLVEWAILSSEKRQGTMRYPSEAWLIEFLDTCPGVKKAIHLCGKDVDAFLAKDSKMLKKVSQFDRVQLNFNQRREPKDLGVLAEVANLVPASVILQHNSANKDLWSLMRHRIEGLSILFDSSGGGGRSPKDGWPDMLPGTVCGFAGGLGPDNIESEFAAISKIAAGRAYWLDMEGKLRSPVDDSFDREACIAVLSRTVGQALDLVGAP